MFNQIRQAAQQKFSHAISQICCPESNRLLYLYDYINDSEIATNQALGVQQVDVEKIQGSLNPGRCRDFDSKFRLLKKDAHLRLSNVEKAWQRKSLPPISLVQVDDIFFVQDGHHRVAISAAKGSAKIRANVTQLQLVA